MLKTLSLILPVLVPSWRFFQTIEPSPRVQWAVLSAPDAAPDDWQEFRPQPATVSLFQMLLRLVWNPARNEDLFVISCAERIKDHPTAHSIKEIRHRIQDDLERTRGDTTAQMLQFRLVFVRRDQTRLVEDVVFVSDPFPNRAPTA